MSNMTRSLDSIPYDVFYQIASTLDCHDYINLSLVNRTLHDLMHNEPIARKAVENNLLHTKEGQEADRTKTGYRRAVGRLFDIKEAFATAQPYSASVLAHGTAFLYKCGYLCYIYNDEIRVLDVHGVGRVEQVLNLHNVISRAIPGCDPAANIIHISLMHYSDGIVAFVVELGAGTQTWLLAVDMRRRVQCGKNGRLRLRTQLHSTHHLFVRHNRSYLYYGTHSGTGYHGYPQWVVSCVDLTTGRHLTEKPVELDRFAGDEIGQTVCFAVHQNHLYAVSTQIDFEEEEVDWTSYYVWICLPPGGDTRSVRPQYIWRRQHREGPINDSWSDLSLRHDEATKQLIILESRREWHNGGSENYRTYYMHHLPSPEEAFKQASKAQQIPKAAQLPDEPLAKTIDSSSNPRYERPQKRLRRHYHSEYQLGSDESSQKRDFILAKTKFRTYNLSASTFIDLVNDPHPEQTGGSLFPHDRLRLRTVSRKRKCPIDEEGEEGAKMALFQRELKNVDGSPMEFSEERFASRGVRLWPPENAPQELNRLLCPSRRAGKVHGVADERSILYSVDHEGISGDNQAIILINFDPSIRPSGLQRLKSGATFRAQEISAGIHIKHPQVGNAIQEEQTTHTTVCVQRTNQALPSVRDEPAMYLRIGHGYWLR